MLVVKSLAMHESNLYLAPSPSETGHSLFSSVPSPAPAFYFLSFLPPVFVQASVILSPTLFFKLFTSFVFFLMLPVLMVLNRHGAMEETSEFKHSFLFIFYKIFWGPKRHKHTTRSMVWIQGACDKIVWIGPTDFTEDKYIKAQIKTVILKNVSVGSDLLFLWYVLMTYQLVSWLVPSFCLMDIVRKAVGMVM